jgi:hypothetical protein
MAISPALVGGIVSGVALATKLASSGNLTGASPVVKFNGATDYRAKLLVPEEYITQYAHGPVNGFNGIVFPYTPTINYEMQATYSDVNPTHSNYNIHFYKNSHVGAFSVTAKFTVQNDADAVYYLTTMHLLRALTKMQYGNDPVAGAPPPVCRFSAYGDYMIQNVPVAIKSFRTDLPDNVDYYVTGVTSNPSPNPNSLAGNLGLGTNFIPTVSQIQLTLIPMYSRYEQSQFSVIGNKNNPGYITDPKLKKQGFL